jgi:uncharacterized protein (DUF4213/DUF364 family)
VTTIDRLIETVHDDAPLQSIIVGAFWTAVVLEGNPIRCGLASSLADPLSHSAKEPPMNDAGQLLGKNARELVEKLRSPSSIEAAVGMATFNAQLEVDESRCRRLNAESIIVEKGAGRRVAVVGHFPFVERIRREVGECWVLELLPRPGDEPAERAKDIVPHADVVAMSGTTLINHTFESLIKLCRSDAFVLLVGASAPLTPLLFDDGVDAICGTRVASVEDVMRGVSQGATFRQIKGRRSLTMFKEGDV